MRKFKTIAIDVMVILLSASICWIGTWAYDMDKDIMKLKLQLDFLIGPDKEPRVHPRVFILEEQLKHCDKCKE